MRILCVCKLGRNRSKYLAGYLKEQGHETKYVGISQHARERLSQEHIEWAQVIITARESFRDYMLANFQISGQRIIALNVHDNPVFISVSALSCKLLRPSAYQERHVYCRLREQLSRHSIEGCEQARSIPEYI